MLIFSYKSKLSNIAEIYGNSVLYNIPELDADVLTRIYLLHSISDIDDINIERNSTCLLYPTIIIDLKLTENDLFRQIHKHAKKNIKRQSWEPITFKEISQPTDHELERFCQLFPNPKGKIEMMERLKAVRDKKALVISYMIDENEEILYAYAYLFNQKQAYGLYASTSLVAGGEKDSLLTRVQQTLHWENILKNKQRGCEWYNFGDTLQNLDEKRQWEIQYIYAAAPAYNLKTYSSETLKGRIKVSSLTRKNPNVIDPKKIGNNT